MLALAAAADATVAVALGAYQNELAGRALEIKNQKFI